MCKIVTKNGHIIKTPDNKAMAASWPVISGTLDITSLGAKDVTNYEYAQIVDDNLSAENIADGVTILGVEGEYQGEPLIISNGKKAKTTAENVIPANTYVNLTPTSIMPKYANTGAGSAYGTGVESFDDLVVTLCNNGTDLKIRLLKDNGDDFTQLDEMTLKPGAYGFWRSCMCKYNNDSVFVLGGDNNNHVLYGYVITISNNALVLSGTYTTALANTTLWELNCCYLSNGLVVYTACELNVINLQFGVGAFSSGTFGSRVNVLTCQMADIEGQNCFKLFRASDLAFVAAWITGTIGMGTTAYFKEQYFGVSGSTINTGDVYTLGSYYNDFQTTVEYRPEGFTMFDIGDRKFATILARTRVDFNDGSKTKTRYSYIIFKPSNGAIMKSETVIWEEVISESKNPYGMLCSSGDINGFFIGGGKANENNIHITGGHVDVANSTVYLGSKWITLPGNCNTGKAYIFAASSDGKYLATTASDTSLSSVYRIDMSNDEIVNEMMYTAAPSSTTIDGLLSESVNPGELKDVWVLNQNV